MFSLVQSEPGGAKGQEARRSRENRAVGAEERGEFIQFPSKLSTYQNVNEWEHQQTLWLFEWGFRQL